jgi:hypothetical protein
MNATVDGHYEGVRFAPSSNKPRPFQVLGFTEDYRGAVENFVILSMSVEGARILHAALGAMLKEVDNV